MSKYWFKRKRYGYGWVPVTWQAFATIIIYMTVVIAAAISIRDVPENTYNSEVGVFLLVAILATAAFLQICYRKGPKPKWRWGKSSEDNPTEDF